MRKEMHWSLTVGVVVALMMHNPWGVAQVVHRLAVWGPELAQPLWFWVPQVRAAERSE